MMFDRDGFYFVTRTYDVSLVSNFKFAAFYRYRYYLNKLPEPGELNLE
jgi:hypothetical protein